MKEEVRFDEASRALYAIDAFNYRQVPVGLIVPRTIRRPNQRRRVRSHHRGERRKGEIYSPLTVPSRHPDIPVVDLFEPSLHLVAIDQVSRPMIPVHAAVVVMLAGAGAPISRQDGLSLHRRIVSHLLTFLLSQVAAPIRLPGTIAVYLIFPLLMVAYDLWSYCRIHRSTAIAVTVITLAVFTMVPVAGMAFPHRVVEWVRHS